MVALAEISWALSLTVGTFVSRLSLDPLSCFPQSRSNSLAFQTSVLLLPPLDLDTYGGVDPLGVFPLFLKKVADILLQN